jgi:hypothetical protein
MVSVGGRAVAILFVLLVAFVSSVLVCGCALSPTFFGGRITQISEGAAFSS